MIDLRSDTLTVPDERMREAMARAAVGDDIYGEDPTINELQTRIADMFGKEAALFVPSGTMGNQIALATQLRSGDEVIADADAHIFHYENAATSVIARAQIYAIKTSDGVFSEEDLVAAIRPNAYYYPRTTMVAVENTHNRHGGVVLSTEYLTWLSEFARSRGLSLHCDGARIWNAIAATGTTPRQYGSIFTSMSVCMSKGAGAPVGSLVIGSAELIEEARRWRKLLGGGMRQAGILAAASLYALDHIVPNLSEDHVKAALFADTISHHPNVTIDRWRVQSNLVMFKVAMNDTDIMNRCEAHGVRIAPIKPGVLRAVFHHQISIQEAETAASVVMQALDQTA